MIEIERKFLVPATADGWRKEVVRQVEIRQGYFGGEGRASVRVRINTPGSANLNIKDNAGAGTPSRAEFQYPLPTEEAQEMLRLFCQGRMVEKTRYFVPAAEAGLMWEIDEYHGPFQGYYTAELEIPAEDFQFQKPQWLGMEVTQDTRYSNAALALTQHWPE